MLKLEFKKESWKIKILYIFFEIVFILFALMNIFPLVWGIMNSLKTFQEFDLDNMALPYGWHFENYIRIFTIFKVRNFYYLDMLFNSLWILAVNVLANVTSSVLLAYALARFRFPGKDFLYAVVIFANTIPIIGTGAAGYKLAMALNLIDNPATIWIAWLTGFDFAFIVFYGNFKGISREYTEAAKIDGASNIKIFLQIVLPQAFPCIVAIAITQAIGVWNNFGISMIYLRQYPNLAYGLYLFSDETNYVEDSKPLYFAAAVVSCIPVIVLYTANQKLLLTNITAGGLKG